MNYGIVTNKEVERIFSEIREAQYREPERKEFTYREHLGDNSELIDDIVGVCLNNENRYIGNKLEIVAPCGSGKTTLILTDITKRLEGKKQVIILTPNKIQSEQNETYSIIDKDGNVVKTIPVTATSGGDFTFDCHGAVSAVYDAVKRLEGISDNDLAKTVLVIDEAHQLYSSRTYRARTIQSIEILSDRVISAGGTVVLMTGTPRKIAGWSVDKLYTCMQVDENGKMVPSYNIGDIHVHQKSSHSANMKDFVTCEIEKLCEGGAIPLVRVNNKDSITNIKYRLTAQGLRVSTLTADEKGYTYAENEDGTKTRLYDSAMYQGIMEEAVLPEADVYLTTSILEVGTSIKYVVVDGKKCQPANLTPVFVCLKPEECDFDDMEQFAARPRFHVDHFYILMNMVNEDKYKAVSYDNTPSIEKAIRQTVRTAYGQCDAYNNAEKYRSSVTTMQGDYEKDCISLTNGHYTPVYKEIMATAWKTYYKKAYQYPSYTQEIVRNEFGLPVEVTVVKDIAHRKENGRVMLPSDLKGSAIKASTDSGFVKAVMNPAGIDCHNETVKAIRKTEGGKQLLTAIRTYGVGCRLSFTDVVKMAIAKTEDPRGVYTTESGETIDNPMLYTVQSVVASFAHMHEGERRDFQNFLSLYYDRSSSDNREASLAFLGNEMQEYRIQSVLDTEEMHAFYAFYKVAYRFRSWMSICNYAAGCTVKELKNKTRECLFTYMNKFEYNSRDYVRTVCPRTLVSGAQYEILRHPQGRLCYADPKDPEKEALHFDGGFEGKTVTKWDLEKIAEKMNDLVHALYKNDLKARTYTAGMVADTLKAIYVYEDKSESDGKKMVIKSLRKDPRISLPGNNLTRQDIITEVEDVFTDVNASYDVKGNTIMATTDRLIENFDYPQDMATAIGMELTRPLTDLTDDYIPYQTGMMACLMRMADDCDDPKEIDIERALRCYHNMINKPFDIPKRPEPEMEEYIEGEMPWDAIPLSVIKELFPENFSENSPFWMQGDNIISRHLRRAA